MAEELRGALEAPQSMAQRGQVMGVCQTPPVPDQAGDPGEKGWQPLPPMVEWTSAPTMDHCGLPPSLWGGGGCGRLWGRVWKDQPP